MAEPKNFGRIKQGRQALTCLRSEQLTSHQNDEFLVLTLLRHIYTALNQVDQAEITMNELITLHDNTPQTAAEWLEQKADISLLKMPSMFRLRLTIWKRMKVTGTFKMFPR